MNDWIHAALKEWYWIVILASLIGLAFTPSFLKAKCPKCGKRGLRTIDTDDHILSHLQAEDRRPFMMFYRCDSCSARLYRERTGPLTDASGERWAPVFEHSLYHI